MQSVVLNAFESGTNLTEGSVPSYEYSSNVVLKLLIGDSSFKEPYLVVCIFKVDGHPKG